MSRILVTGGSGFIGTNLIESLKSDNLEICNFDIKPPINKEHLAFYCAGDIVNAGKFQDALREFQPDFVVHLAARTDLDGKTVEDYSANTVGIQNVIDTLRLHTIKRVIFASSRYVHQTEVQPTSELDYSPFTPYGESKVIGEQIIRSSHLGVPWTLIRPTSIWGPWFGVPYKGFFSAVRNGLYLHPGREKLYKTYGYVGNVVHEIRALLDAPIDLINGKTLYVADYEPIEIRNFAEMIRLSFGARPVRNVPLPVMKSLAAVGDLMKLLGVKSPPLTSFRLNNLRSQMLYDMTATERVVGPLPYTHQRGVDATVQWMRECERND